MTDPNDKYRPPARPPTIAVDYDGTICEWAFPECGAPRTEVIDALRILREKGWQIVIHTCRVNSCWEEPDRTEKVQDMLEWLYENEVPFHGAWGLDIALATMDVLADGWHLLEAGPVPALAWRYSTETGKPLADVYLDDRGFWAKPRALGAETIATACYVIGGIEAEVAPEA